MRLSKWVSLFASIKRKCHIHSFSWHAPSTWECFDSCGGKWRMETRPHIRIRNRSPLVALRTCCAFVLWSHTGPCRCYKITDFLCTQKCDCCNLSRDMIWAIVGCLKGSLYHQISTVLLLHLFRSITNERALSIAWITVWGIWELRKLVGKTFQLVLS